MLAQIPGMLLDFTFPVPGASASQEFVANRFLLLTFGERIGNQLGCHP